MQNALVTCSDSGTYVKEIVTVKTDILSPYCIECCVGRSIEFPLGEAHNLRLAKRVERSTQFLLSEERWAKHTIFVG